MQTRIKVVEVESHNRYQCAGEQSEREERKQRDRNRRESRKAKYQDACTFFTDAYRRAEAR